MNDKELFKALFDNFSERYKGLSMTGTIVCYNGEMMFNTDGYNLLYNAKRLCDMLKHELR